MTENQKNVLNMINNEQSISRIISKLDISEKRLIKIIQSLENKGYCIKKKYNMNGEIFFDKKSIQDGKTYDIKTNSKNNRLLVISDTHLGSKFDRIDLLDKVYEYAIKNNIHIILHCGDFLDGIYNDNGRTKNKNIELQCKYALSKYPSDKSITNFLIFGNHDYASLKKYGIDIKTVIENNRIDIIPIDYGYGTVKICNENITMYHKLSNNSRLKSNSKINLIGHTHKCSSDFGNNCLDIYVPSLCDLSIHNDFLGKGMLDINLRFNNNILMETDVSHLIFEPKTIVCSENSYQFSKKNLQKR